MSITLNNSDFQCLQDQLVDLKTKNYELAEKTRRSQADFEAAKAKICSLQLKLEEQEREFQMTSTTLRREIEAISNQGSIRDNNDSSTAVDKENKDEDYKVKYKKLLHKAKELQQRYEKSVEVVQQTDNQNKCLTERLRKVEEENNKMREVIKISENKLNVIENEHQEALRKALEEFKLQVQDDNKQRIEDFEAIKADRDSLRIEVDRLTNEVNKFDQRLESEIEERKINERKGLQTVKELKRQLALEKNRTETLQKRLEHLLSAPAVPNTDIDGGPTRLSTSSSTNGNSSSNGNGSRTNQDTNSVGSWSFVAGKTKSAGVCGANETTLSLCSIDSEDRETVQQPCDNNSEDSPQIVASPIDAASRQCASSTATTTDNTSSSSKQASPNKLSESLKQNFNSTAYQPSERLSVEDQAALVDRLTKMQHDNWMLEEKLSYLEQANSTLSEDVANKSDIIKQYFMDQAIKVVNNHNNHNDHIGFTNSSANVTRRTSLTSNVSVRLSEKPSFKKMVDFIKDKSQIANSETENVSREATKRMQLMLEETLIKCQKLQENLDYVTSELNKYKS